MPTADDGLFGGIATFAHLPYHECWSPGTTFDIAFIGAPFDTRNKLYNKPTNTKKMYLLLFDQQ
jgi:hypothetical protein